MNTLKKQKKKQDKSRQTQKQGHKQCCYLPRCGIAPKEGKAVLKPIVYFVQRQLSILGLVDGLKQGI